MEPLVNCMTNPTLFVDHLGLCFRKAGLDNKNYISQGVECLILGMARLLRVHLSGSCMAQAPRKNEKPGTFKRPQWKVIC